MMPKNGIKKLIARKRIINGFLVFLNRVGNRLNNNIAIGTLIKKMSNKIIKKL